MNAFDLVLFAVLLSFAAVGALRGAMREALSLATWGVSVGAGALFNAPVSTWFGWLDEPALRQMVAFVVIFCTMFLLATIGAFVLRVFLGSGRPGPGARAAGAFLGAGRATMVLVILVLLAGLTSMPQKPWWRQSSFMGAFEYLAVTVRDWLPEDVGRQFVYG
jgi:membrane protein required for colicin V production